ncbi:MAG TPA: hypothetical protein IAA05_06095 [Candidatus Blautia excrementipullorum]|nr:hypothetical protein [Candidatus Blautia excrementipullorum]
MVSGIGYYTTQVTLPESWDNLHGAVLQIGSLNKNTGAVYVNGIKAGNLNFDKLEQDISRLLHPGQNEIRVKTATSLNNRLLARGYYQMGNLISGKLASHSNNTMPESNTIFDVQAKVRNYGMIGPVKLKTYILCPLP